MSRNPFLYKSLVVGVIVLFVGVGIQPAISDVSISNKESIIYPKPSLYTGFFVYGRIHGEIDYWEDMGDGYTRIWPKDVLITGILFDERFPLYFKYFIFRIPPDYGHSWRFVFRFFIGKLDDNSIQGLGIFVTVGGFGEK